MCSAVPATTAQSVIQEIEGDTWELCGYPQVLRSGVEIQGQGKGGNGWSKYENITTTNSSNVCCSVVY